MNKSRVAKLIKKTIKNLTIFDYISLGLVLGFMVVLGLFLSREVELIEVEMRVESDDIFWQKERPPYWLGNSVNVGDYELDGLGRKAVEVTDLRVYEGVRSGGLSEEKYIYLTLKVRAVKDSRKNQYLFKSKPLAVGSSIELRLSKVLITGLVTYVEGMPDTRVWEDKIVEARTAHWSEIFPDTLGLLPWRAEAIKVGDQMKDTRGRAVAEVLDRKIKPAEKIVVTADGRVLLRQDPLKKDVILTIKLKTYKQNGVNYYLDDLKVKVGSAVLLALPEIDIWPEITKIIE